MCSVILVFDGRTKHSSECMNRSTARKFYQRRRRVMRGDGDVVVLTPEVSAAVGKKPKEVGFARKIN